MKFRVNLFVIFCGLSLFWLGACSSTKPDYKAVYTTTIQENDDLEIPPGMDAPQIGSDLLPELQKSIKSASTYQESLKGVPKSSSFTRDYQGMNFVREGSLFWLEVDAPGNEVWADLRNFFIRLGFEISIEQPEIGYMQTNWLLNKEDVPTNFLSSLLDKLFSSSEKMDRYRLRLEWDAEKKRSRVFVSHQGLREIIEGVDDNISVVQTKWVPRASESELEVELLMRFMAFRGLNVEDAKETVAGVKSKKVAEVKTADNKSSLMINEPFARGWRHVGIAMDRLGYKVDDKNRSAGVYYVTLPETFVIPKQNSLLGKILGNNFETPKHLKYLIILQDNGESTQVTIKANGEVKDDISRVETKILNDLQSSIL